MTTRERHLAVIVGSVLGVGALFFVAYSFVLGPWVEKNRQIKQRESEVLQLQLTVEEILIQKKKFETFRQQSLPNDVGVSRTQYSNLLGALVRRADFADGTFKITVGEADGKSAPVIAPKKPAYTKLNYEVTVKGELYHFVEFMRLFYSQPLLHQIKSMNIQRPSDARQRGANELDVTMKIEALVLDNALPRPTLLPIVREFALLSGPAAHTGLNMVAVANGRGAALPPAGIMADADREHLAIAAKNIFFGPPPPKPREASTREDDVSPFIVLTSIIGRDDGSIEAVFRDQLFNHNYTITQNAGGGIHVKGEYEIKAENEPFGKKKTMVDYIGYSERKPCNEIMYGSEEGQNRRVWRVRRVNLDNVILEKLDAPSSVEKPKPPALVLMTGGPGVFMAVPEGKIYKVAMGQTLDTSGKRSERGPAAASKFTLTREACQAIYASTALPASEPGPLTNGR